MASERAIAWIERLVWILIYGGLFLVILGIITHDAHLVAGWSLGAIGGAVAVAGTVLIWVRSRMRGPSDPPDNNKPSQ